MILEMARKFLFYQGYENKGGNGADGGAGDAPAQPAFVSPLQNV